MDDELYEELSSVTGESESFLRKHGFSLLQPKQGRHFRHEHPASGSSWQLPRMQALRSRPGVGEAVSHLWQYGMGTRGPSGHTMPALNPT